jgi:hypothetical protein
VPKLALQRMTPSGASLSTASSYAGEEARGGPPTIDRPVPLACNYSNATRLGFACAWGLSTSGSVDLLEPPKSADRYFRFPPDARVPDARDPNSIRFQPAVDRRATWRAGTWR